MASKSKKRRRVLGASCILAALIIAGSSFAWFTSSDEVTNRLSANADYDVSIVESFAPPANWLPGQEVNKDVYAVNTGSTAAFVEETVSGVMTVTKEVADSTTPTANSLKLTQAERYSIEAGSYLAYAPTTSNLEKGTMVVAMTPDPSNLDGYTAAAATDFKPDAIGLYVFRRKITVDGTSDPKGLESFKYEGYYYDGKDFYKVTDLKVEPDTISYAGDNDATDGNLKSATAKTVKEVTTTGVPTLAYDSANNRLVATYNVGTDTTSLESLAEAYDNALIAYKAALEEYQAAVRDNTGANNTVTAERRDLDTAINNLLNKEDELATKKAALKAAQEAEAARLAEYNAALKTLDDKMVALYGYPNGGETTKDATAQTYDSTNPTATAGHYTTTSAFGKWKDAQEKDNTANDELTTATTALGDPGDPKNATGSAYAQYNFAKDAVDNYTNPDSKDAFEAWCAAQSPAINLNTISYDDLITKGSSGSGITNTDVAYDYYRKVVELKKEEKDLQDAKDAKATAEAKKAVTEQKLADALAAKNAASGAVDAAKVDLYGHKDGGTAAAASDDTNGEANNYTTGSAYGRYQAAVTNTATKQSEVEGVMVELYGHKNGGTTALTTAPGGEADKYTAGSLYGQFKDAEDQYNTAVKNATGTTPPTTATKLTDAQNKLAAATQTKNEAEKAYNDAVANPAANEIKININLSDDVVTATSGNPADKWQLLPTTLVDTDGNNTFDTARFYYTGILDAGETSSKLIDSVELDSSVTDDMFKRFDFDLNVALKSAQIAYNEAGEITADAANSTLDANAAVATPSSIDSAVNWTLK